MSRKLRESSKFTEGPETGATGLWRAGLLIVSGLLIFGSAFVIVLHIRNSGEIEAQLPAGYNQVAVETLTSLQPPALWMGREVEGYPLLFAAAPAKRRDSSAAIYYGSPGELTSLAIFLRPGTEGVEQKAVSSCRRSRCPRGFKLVEVSGGAAVVKSYQVDSWEALLVIGESRLYIISDLPGLTVSEALAALRPLSAD